MTVHSVILQHALRHSAGDQAGQIDAAKQLILVGLFGQEPFNLPGAGDAPAEPVDGMAFGLPGLAQDKQVVSGQQGNGDEFNEFFPFGDLLIDFGHEGQQFLSQILKVVPFSVDTVLCFAVSASKSDSSSRPSAV